MEKIMNAGIQVVPVNIVDPTYSIVDKAIAVIQQSGMEYTVTPFETVVNGTTEQILQLIAQLKTTAEEAGADELIINTRFHSKKTADNIFNSKINKF
ncbi:thiamine-binding protein [Lacibacter sp. H407]|uniref:thiamine-binding protein n=1 Tax=Lacibacter sp. H407 TaxID=3133423 RepID=UPI0030C0C63A